MTDKEQAIQQVAEVIALGVGTGRRPDTIAIGIISLGCIGVIASEQPDDEVIRGSLPEYQIWTSRLKEQGWRKLADKDGS